MDAIPKPINAVRHPSASIATTNSGIHIDQIGTPQVVMANALPLYFLNQGATAIDMITGFPKLNPADKTIKPM